MAKSDGNPYENLAAAIIVTACNDYRMTLKKISSLVMKKRIGK